MIEFGKTLRAAREAKGLEARDIAQKTHMMIQTVEGLENEDFSKIVAPIYGRGFVKLYCEVVGLEPKPMVDAFMELYNGTRSAGKANPAPVPQPSAPAPSVPPPDAPEPPPTPPLAASEPPPPQPAFEPLAPKPEPTLSRYAGNLPAEDEPRFRLPSIDINWRLVTLGAAAFAILLLAMLAIRSLYRATMTAPADAADEARTEEVAPPAPAPLAGEPKRKPLPVKPFYIDSDHSTETERK